MKNKKYILISLASIFLLNSCNKNIDICSNSIENSINSLESQSNTTQTNTTESDDYKHPGDNFYCQFPDVIYEPISGNPEPFVTTSLRDLQNVDLNNDLTFWVGIRLNRNLYSYDYYCSIQYRFDDYCIPAKQGESIYVEKQDYTFYKKHFYNLFYISNCYYTKDDFFIEVTIPSAALKENYDKYKYLVVMYVDNASEDGYVYTDGIKNEVLENGHYHPVMVYLHEHPEEQIN